MEKLPRKTEGVNPSVHLDYSKNESHPHTQLGAVRAQKPNLTVAHVSENFALADDRFHINAASWGVGTPLTTDKVYKGTKRIGSRLNPGSICIYIAIRGGAA